MTWYWVQLRDRIFAKGYGFLSFARNMGKNIGKNISKNLRSKCSQKLIDHATDAFKTAAKKKKAIRKKQKQLVIWLATKLPIQLQKSEKIHHRITQKQMKKKYLDKDISLGNGQQIINDLRSIQ